MTGARRSGWRHVNTDEPVHAARRRFLNAGWADDAHAARLAAQSLFEKASMPSANEVILDLELLAMTTSKVVV